MQGELSRGEEMLPEKNIEILRTLFRQYNYVMTTAELTASKLYYADIKLLLEEGLIKKSREVTITGLKIAEKAKL